MPAKCADSVLPLRFFPGCRKTRDAMERKPQSAREGKQKTSGATFGPASKSPLKSRGVVGSLVVIGATAAQSAGLDLGERELSDLIFAALQLIGGVLALVGRWKARTAIR